MDMHRNVRMNGIDNKRILYLRFDFLYLLCIQLDLDAKRKGIIRLLEISVESCKN